MKKLALLYFICFITFGSCSETRDESILPEDIQINTNIPDEGNDPNQEADTTNTNIPSLKILALGDSYTIGQNVCETCRFPVQLRDSLSILRDEDISVNILARTGWTTTALINAIVNEDNSSTYDLVTLLIGVNNQFQNKPFSLFQNEFPILIQKAIRYAKSDKNKVIVLSIPDYAFTPFGQNSENPEVISAELDQYNSYIQNYCEERSIAFINITDITRFGLEQPDLVASDGLHPSELAYTKFVERILPIAIQKLQ